MEWDYGVALEQTPPLKPCGPFVDGSSVDGEPSTTLNPATDEPLIEVGVAGQAAIDRAVAAGRRAFGEWAGLPGADRARILFRVARVVAARAGDLAVLEALDTGRPVRRTRDVDLPWVVAHLQSCAGWADKLDHAGHGPDPRPVGVLAALAAGGAALLGAVRRVGPALACGNTVVLAPDPDAPLTALVLAEVAAEAGLPAGVLNVLPGAAVGLAGHAGVDAVAVTGAPLARPHGRLLVEPADRGVHVVHDDAPLDQAVDGVLEGLGTDRRVLVAESVADEFGELLRERVARLRVGEPLDRNTDVGPVGSRERRDRAAALIAAGGEEGATRFATPAALPDRGLYLAPTVFTGVAPAMRLAREEITGPVVPVLTFRTAAEAVALAGAVRTAAVWTDKGSRALWTAQRLRAGAVWVNGVDRWDPAVPGGALAEYLDG
jgi:aldehyde dehydrogenase (NAD+)